MNTPRTIEELEYACRENKFPLRAMHVYIGDTDMPKTFGIYKDKETGDVVLYKNNSNGERKVRYQGPDEARAVGELWQKILELYEMGRKKEQPAPSQSRHQENPSYQQRMTRAVMPSEPYPYQQPAYQSGHVRQVRQVRRRQSLLRPLCGAIIFVAVILFITGLFSLLSSCDGTVGTRRGGGFSRGYYAMEDAQYYYRPSSGWYRYDTGLHSWNKYTPPLNWALYDSYEDYYIGADAYDFGYGYDVTDFEEWYEETYPSYNYDYSHNYDYATPTPWHYSNNDWDDDYYSGGSSWDNDYNSGSSWDSNYDYDYDDDYNSSFDYSYDYDSYDWDSDW